MDFDISVFKSKNEDLSKFIKLDIIKNNIAAIYNMIGESPINKHIIYYRNSNGESILGLQLVDGKEKDKRNYIFYGCSAFNSTGLICDIYVQANEKVAQKAQIVLNSHLLKYYDFFMKTEQELIDNGLFDASVSYIDLLDNTKEKSKIKQLVQSFTKKLK